jgi:hypothetical protein
MKPLPRLTKETMCKTMGSGWTSPELMDTSEMGNTMYLGVSSDDSKRSKAV